MMFTFNSCSFVVVYVLSLMLSAKADTIRGALQQSKQRELTSTLLSPSTLGSNGASLPSGDYIAHGIVTLPGILILSTPSRTSSDTWNFTFDSGAFITAAASNIVFFEEDTNTTIVYDAVGYDTHAARVTWVVKGAITLGASSKVGGTMKSEETITLGASAQCGRLEAHAAIVLGASADSGPLISDAAITVGAGASCGPIRAGAAITVGAGATISVLRPGPGAATTVGAGVACESGVPAYWLVAAPCACDPKYNNTTAVLELRGDDCRL